MLRGEIHMEMVLQISSQGVPMAAAKDPWQEQMNMKQHGWVELKKQNTPTNLLQEVYLSLSPSPSRRVQLQEVYIYIYMAIELVDVWALHPVE